MNKRQLRGSLGATVVGLSAIALSALINTPLIAQEPPQVPPQAPPQVPGKRVAGNQTSDSTLPPSGIQRIIENSTLHFQSAEANFRNGSFDRARRDYDRALDTILESGVDIRSDARLQQHYQGLVEQIYQRQMTLMVVAPASSGAITPADSTNSANNANDKGFGQQPFTPSPLDELTKLDLTEDETRGVTAEQARKAVTTARIDFNFKPNYLIQSFINYYQGRGRATMENGLRRAGRFLSMSRAIFKEEGVPQDLVWLGQVESAWSPIARSWAAAVGLWQFIPGTGARFGLQQDSYVDERSSFEKATRASARYLKFLANRYDGNWELAMAAYNSGEGRVDSAVAKSGYADFWEIYSRGLLPNETRNYVPNILATIIIAKHPEHYGFSVKPEPALTYDFVKVNNLVDLRLVADATDTQPDLIEALNPELKRGVTPPGDEYLLRVPAGKGRALHAALSRIPVEKRSSWRMLTAQAGDTFESIARRIGISSESIEQVNGGVIGAGRKVIVPVNGNVRSVVLTSARSTRAETRSETAPGSRSNVERQSGGQQKQISYRVRKGETLGDIAGRYSTSASSIASLNRLGRSARLRAGQTLRIPIR